MINEKDFNEKDFYRQRLSQTEKLLSLKQHQVNGLLEITQAINKNIGSLALYRIYEFVMIAQMGVKKIALFVPDDGDKWQAVCKTGAEHIVDKIDVERDLLGFSDLATLEKNINPNLKEFYCIIPVIQNEKHIAVALFGKFDDDVADTLEEKLKYLRTITNMVAVANENTKMIKLQISQEVLKKELELAGHMQSFLIPDKLPENDHLEMDGIYLPHQNIGGDYYDFIKLDDDEYAFCIADISGKGVPAGLLMANFQANVRTLLKKEFPLDQLVDMLNHKVLEIARSEKFITFFVGNYNTETRKLTYVNAGHNPSILINGNEVKHLDKGSTILGMLDELPFINIGTEQLEEGAVIVNFTDGLTDLMNNSGEIFEPELLEEFIVKNKDLSMNALVKKLMLHINEFKQDQTYIDDVSVLACRFL